MALAKSAKPEYKPTEQHAWAGMNNILPPHALGATRERPALLRNAVNVSFDAAGRPRLRSGRRQIYPGSNVRSLFRSSTDFLFAEGDSVKQLNTDTNLAAVVGTGISPARKVAFVEVDGGVFWSDGGVTGKVGDTLWGIPLAPAPILTAVAGGSLPAGRYHVTVTLMHGTEEGGALGLFPIDVTEGQNIRVAGLTGTSRIYVSMTNGETALFHGQTTAASYDIGASSNLGAQLKTLRAYPFPACDVLAYYNGRVWGATGRYVFRSMAFQPRLCFIDRDWLLFDSDVRLLAPVRDGMYVSDGQATYFLPQADNGAVAGQVEVLPYPAVAGTLAVLKVDEGAAKDIEVAWFSERGWVVAADGGNVKNIGEKNIAIRDKIMQGAACHREVEGRRELISALQSGGIREGAVIGDYAEAEVIRNGRRI